MAVTLNNMILPFLFFEIGYILISLLLVIILETIIVNKFINQGFGKLFGILFFANIATTIFGYLFQGFVRLLLIGAIFNFSTKNTIIEGLSGNIGMKSKWLPEDNLSVFISIFTGIVIALFISIFFERKILIHFYKGKVETKLLSKSIKYGNIVSYTFLFFWIYLNYRFL